VNFLKLVVNSFGLLVIFCGKAHALPQDWPCKFIHIKKVKEISVDGVSFEKEYYGEAYGFSLSITNQGLYDFPYSGINCGSSGCIGVLTELKTKQIEYPRFDCNFTDNENILSCYMIDCK
jgi:hypothetical protein